MLSGVATETCSAKVDIGIDVTKKLKNICERVHF